MIRQQYQQYPIYRESNIVRIFSHQTSAFSSRYIYREHILTRLNSLVG